MPTIEQRVVGEMEVVDLGRQDHHRVSAVCFLEGPERLDVRPARSQDVHEVLVQSTVVIRGDHPNLSFRIWPSKVALDAPTECVNSLFFNKF